MMSLMKSYHNSQRMSNSFYHITESGESDLKIRVQNITAILHWKHGLLCDKDRNCFY